jgi:hypothetical protein
MPEEKDDADIDQIRLDEAQLDKELAEMDVESARATARERRSSFLKPVITAATIFLLTTGLLTFLTLIHTNYTSCRAHLDDAQERFERLRSEIYFRWGAVHGFRVNLHGNYLANEDLSGFRTLFDPNQTYKYSEFKGKSSSELAEEANLLLRRWHREEAQEMDRTGKLPPNHPYLKYIGPRALFDLHVQVGPGPFNKPPSSISPPPLLFFPEVAEGVLSRLAKEDSESKSNILKDIVSWDDLMNKAELDLWKGSDPDPFPVNTCLSVTRLFEGSPGTPPPPRTRR